jgi:hypothetical protein
MKLAGPAGCSSRCSRHMVWLAGLQGLPCAFHDPGSTRHGFRGKEQQQQAGTSLFLAVWRGTHIIVGLECDHGTNCKHKVDRSTGYTHIGSHLAGAGLADISPQLSQGL